MINLYCGRKLAAQLDPERQQLIIRRGVNIVVYDLRQTIAQQRAITVKPGHRKRAAPGPIELSQK